jgi:hypothetical protein
VGVGTAEARRRNARLRADEKLGKAVVRGSRSSAEEGRCSMACPWQLLGITSPLRLTAAGFTVAEPPVLHHSHRSRPSSYL